MRRGASLPARACRRRSPARTWEPSRWRRPPGSRARPCRTVRVLDFRNITADPAFDWLSTGIAETLTTDLGKLQTLAVVSRDRVVRAFGAPGSSDGPLPEPTEAGRRLGLDLVVSGGFQTLGRSIRLTAALIDVARGEITGSVKVDGVLDEVFSLQDRLVAGLAEAARVEVPDAARGRLARATDPKVEAYELFGRGRQLVQRMGPTGLSEARGLLERAVEIDPRYALAHAALGSARAMRFIATSDTADLEAAVSHLTRATLLDPHLGEPYAWLAYCRGRQHRFGEARAAGRRAVELDPGGFYGFYFLGTALWMEGSEAFRPGVWAEAALALLGGAEPAPGGHDQDPASRRLPEVRAPRPRPEGREGRGGARGVGPGRRAPHAGSSRRAGAHARSRRARCGGRPGRSERPPSAWRRRTTSTCRCTSP